MMIYLKYMFILMQFYVMEMYVQDGWRCGLSWFGLLWLYNYFLSIHVIDVLIS